MKENLFFEKQTISSKIKASIVSEYFPSYCKIIVKKHTPQQIRYIDLFAGPGIYDDQSASTPVLIGKHCQRDGLLYVVNLHVFTILSAPEQIAYAIFIPVN